MVDEGNKEGRFRDVFGELIASFVCLDLYFTIFQTHVTTRHMAVAFNIPTQNIGIYFSKLYSLASLLMATGAVLEYAIYRISPGARGHISLASLFLKSLTRLAFSVATYTSRSLSLHIYIVLNSEMFFHGIFQNSFFALVPEYSSMTAMSIDFSLFCAFLIQLVFDLFLYKKPLMMIKLQSLIRFISSIVGLAMWSFYIIGFDSVFPKSTRNSGEGQETETEVASVKGGGDATNHFLNASSQFMMFGAASLFKDFLIPSIIPYAVLERDKCHLVNLAIPVSCLLGSGTILLVHKHVDEFRRWDPLFNLIWAFTVPMLVVSVLTLMAIHTRKPLTLGIRNSQLRVLVMATLVIYSYTVMQSTSYVGVANYVFHQSHDQAGSLYIITSHNISAILYRFVFTKLSVGYNDVRIATGYHLPRFRPRHRMSDWNTFWYILRKTFSRGFTDTVSDFRMNIREYL